MQKKFEINQTKIKGGCQSGRKVVTHNSKSALPLDMYKEKSGETKNYLHLSLIILFSCTYSFMQNDLVEAVVTTIL